MTTAEPVLAGAWGQAEDEGGRQPSVGSQRALRDVLGRYATGVAVVTTSHQGRPVGVTVNSFTSVSLDPPLVLWCLGTESRQMDAFVGAGHFAVNILGADQSALATRFTRRGDRFAGLPPQAGPYGLPLLPGVIGVLVCRRARMVPAGDHVILLGSVRSHRSAPGPALLFADGGYHPGPDGP